MLGSPDVSPRAWAAMEIVAGMQNPGLGLPGNLLPKEYGRSPLTDLLLL